MVSSSDVMPLDKLNELVNQRRSELSNETLREYVFPFEEGYQSHSSETPISEKKPPKHLIMKRVIFWSHHLVAPSKRKQFAAWCPELQVWGLLKLGYPGFLLFEGEADDIDDMNMQWHAISMRVEVTWSFESQNKPEDIHTQALRSCALAAGRSVVEGPKLRTDCQEVQDMGQLRRLSLPEEEIVDACHLRKTQ
ncbi:hypothetical protein CBS14141_002924 [Malassezia furfur]|nr:hypothetical protein CBS14141_002924 [Malassezia furfur]